MKKFRKPDIFQATYEAVDETRWNDETREMVARTLCGSEVRASEIEQAIPYAESVLAALADAGLLVPPDAERRTEVGIQVSDGVTKCSPMCADLGEHTPDELARRRYREVITFATWWKPEVTS